MDSAEPLGPGKCDECEVNVEARRRIDIGSRTIAVCYKCQTGFLSGKTPRKDLLA